MKQSLSFLLSGPGLIGRQHAALISAHSKAVLTAIVAPARDRNIEFAAQQGARHYTSVEKALATEQIDAAIISSPNVFHHEQAMACLEHGVPVLIEKPLADSLSHAAVLVKASDHFGVPALVGHHRTYSPLLAVARSFINSDRFGHLASVHGSALFYKPTDYFEAGPWRTKKGGGPILINLIHEIGIMRYLCGEIVAVSAASSRAARGFEVEDTVGIVIIFANGAIGTFLLSDAAASNKSWEMTAGENPTYPHFPDDDCYHFAGSMGSLDFPSMRARSYIGAAKRSWWEPFNEERLPFEPRNPLEQQIDHFINVVQGLDTPRVTVWDGYANMRVIAAIERAAAEQRKVEIDEIPTEAAAPATGVTL
jgi:predicted dehydrogenase